MLPTREQHPSTSSTIIDAFLNISHLNCWLFPNWALLLAVKVYLYSFIEHHPCSQRWWEGYRTSLAMVIKYTTSNLTPFYYVHRLYLCCTKSQTSAEDLKQLCDPNTLGLESLEGFFTHRSGAWTGMTWRLGSAETANQGVYCCLSSLSSVCFHKLLYHDSFIQWLRAPCETISVNKWEKYGLLWPRLRNHKHHFLWATLSSHKPTQIQGEES